MRWLTFSSNLVKDINTLPEFFYFSDSLSKSREDSSLRGEPRACIEGGFATKENRKLKKP